MLICSPLPYSGDATDLLYTMPSMVGIVGRAPAVDAMKQCDFQNNYGTVAQRKVSSCASIFKFLYGSPVFFLRGKFIPKIAIFAILAAIMPHF